MDRGTASAIRPTESSRAASLELISESSRRSASSGATLFPSGTRLDPERRPGAKRIISPATAKNRTRTASQACPSPSDVNTEASANVSGRFFVGAEVPSRVLPAPRPVLLALEELLEPGCDPVGGVLLQEM